MATEVTQFYKSLLVYGTVGGTGVVIPTLPGARLTVPQNWDVPPIIGNYWQLNYGDGLLMPTVDVQLVVRNATAEALSTRFFSLFTTRSNDAAHDTSDITGGISFWDGYTGFTLTGARADSFMIGCSKGDSIRMSCRFVGNGLSGVSSIPTPGLWTGFAAGKTYRFNKVLMDPAGPSYGAGSLSNTVWRFDLSYSNNHTPNLSLDGTQYPTAMNAGMQTVGFNLMNQAGDAVSGVSGFHRIQIGDTTSPDVVSATFDLANVLDNTPNDRQIEQPRVMRRHTFTCLSTDAQATTPLTITCST